MYELNWKEGVLRDLEKLGRSISLRIVKKIERLKQGISFSEVKRVQNSKYFRLRIGDYRIIFSLEKNILTIMKVGHRKKVYKL